ncbi:tigger transposable element-derived protein 6-like [Euwallacea similis]|uniref:tigger transposable element-derived protein 6-like n=1 Tax=Euwallacea similis TaxID=1736056 RepID=UPI00344ED2A6
MTGQKEKLLVIEKSAHPRALKNINIKDLSVMWKSNKKAWMTRDIMSEWLIELDRKMGIENRKILLFLDNAASHPRELPLRNVKIIFLPPNTTCVCQPLDQGVIQNFKFYYRNQILNHILSNMDCANSLSELSKKINVLEAVYFIKTTWQKVDPATIENCYIKAGFRKSDTTLPHFDPEDDLPLSVLVIMMKATKELNFTNDKNLEKFINIDQNTPTEDDDFENQVTAFSQHNENIETYDEIEDVEEEENKIKCYDEALNYIRELKNFSKGDYVAFEQIKNLECHYQKCRIEEQRRKFKQPSILKIFQAAPK